MRKGRGATIELATGIDLLEIGRMRKSMQSAHFLERVFSPQERELLAARGMSAQTAAANFCAKEAFAKSLGTGVRGFALCEAALLRDALGKPYFVFSGAAKRLVESRALRFSVSVTHTREYAAAFVVCYSNDE